MIRFPSNDVPAPHAYSFTVPAGWERVAGHNSMTLRSVKSQSSGPAQITIRTVQLPVGVDLADVGAGFAGRIVAKMRNGTINAARVGRLNGNRAAIQSITFDLLKSGERGLLLLALLCAPEADSSAELFIVRFTCAEVDADAHQGAFFEVLKSLELGSRLSV